MSGTALATGSIRGLTEDLQSRSYRLAKCAVLTASGRELPPLAGMLAAHPLIHTAEGSFFATRSARRVKG
jgi:hypothetical protein